MTPDQYCRNKAARSGSSLYYSMRSLPPDQRCAITALYAFCREVNGVIDECSDSGVAHMKLGWWRTEIAHIYDGVPQHPVARALAAAVPRFRITAPRLNAIIDGIESDLDCDRYADFDALTRYCYHVAGTASIVCAEIAGYRDAATLRYAAELGIALRLTAIIRDIGKDARRGRVYLPQDDLARFGVTERDILELRESERFTRLTQFQIERTAARYQQAVAALPAIDRKAQRAGLALAAIQRTLLHEIAVDGCHVLTRRTALTPLRKLWIAWKTRIQN
ncbi:MAG: presqualene diphosphate synthase HpnD [Burkholderiales bacterium]